MKTDLVITLLFSILVCACTRGPERNTAQSGPLVGIWKYSAPSPYYRYQVVAGDHSWWIQEQTEFRPDGTLNSSQPQTCNYWIESPTLFKLDCGHGQTKLRYEIKDSTLTIPIRSWKDDEPVTVDVIFKRVE